jgi:hypothetical protein
MRRGDGLMSNSGSREAPRSVRQIVEGTRFQETREEDGWEEGWVEAWKSSVNQS